MSTYLQGTVPTGVAGVFKKPGAILNQPMLNYLAALRRLVSFDLVVTSGVRTIAEQASAMLTKFQLGGQQELHATYSNDAEITRMVSEYGPPSLASFTQALQDQVGRGVYMSRHMRGDGLDFRVSGLTPAQVNELQVAASAAGAKNVLYEGTPPHLHVDGFSGAIALPALAGKSVLLGVAGGAIGGGVLLAFMFWYLRRRRR